MSSIDNTPLTEKETRALNFRGLKNADIQKLTPADARALLAQPRTVRPKAAKPAAKRSAKAIVEKAVKARTPKPLNPTETTALELLGYTPDHILSLTFEHARELIANKTCRPGSRAYNEANGSPLPERYTDEAIAAANRNRPAQSGVVMELDEYTQRCVRGDDPIDAVLLDLQERFPGRRFRCIDPNANPYAGPQFQKVYDDQGKTIQVGDLEVGFMPEEVYQDYYVKGNLKRSEQQMGAITQGRMGEDGDVAIAPKDRHYAPVEGKGMTIEPNFANL